MARETSRLHRDWTLSRLFGIDDECRIATRAVARFGVDAERRRAFDDMELKRRRRSFGQVEQVARRGVPVHAKLGELRFRQASHPPVVPAGAHCSKAKEPGSVRHRKGRLRKVVGDWSEQGHHRRPVLARSFRLTIPNELRHHVSRRSDGHVDHRCIPLRNNGVDAAAFLLPLDVHRHTHLVTSGHDARQGDASVMEALLDAQPRSLARCGCIVDRHLDLDLLVDQTPRRGTHAQGQGDGLHFLQDDVDMTNLPARGEPQRHGRRSVTRRWMIGPG